MVLFGMSIHISEICIHRFTGKLVTPKVGKKTLKSIVVALVNNLMIKDQEMSKIQ